MLNLLKRCCFRSKSLPRGIPLLVHKFINTRIRYVRRNAIKANASGPLETPTTIARRKSCEGDQFGYFRSSKEWMQLVKVDNPQHRNQNLAKIVFLRLKHGNSQSQSKRILSLKKLKLILLQQYIGLPVELQDQALKTKQICYVYYQHLNQKQLFNKLIISNNPRKLICHFYHLLRLKCIPNCSPSINPLELNYYVVIYTIDQPLFPKKIHRNWSQLDMLPQQKAITQPSSNYVSPRKFKKSIMNIYGISNTMHLIKY